MYRHYFMEHKVKPQDKVNLLSTELVDNLHTRRRWRLNVNKFFLNKLQYREIMYFKSPPLKKIFPEEKN